jgi:hypothetical protein
MEPNGLFMASVAVFFVTAVLFSLAVGAEIVAPQRTVPYRRYYPGIFMLMLVAACLLLSSFVYALNF